MSYVGLGEGDAAYYIGGASSVESEFKKEPGTVSVRAGVTNGDTVNSSMVALGVLAAGAVAIVYLSKRR